MKHTTEPIAVQAADGTTIHIEIAEGYYADEGPTIYITDPHRGEDFAVRVMVNGVER